MQSSEDYQFQRFGNVIPAAAGRRPVQIRANVDRGIHRKPMRRVQLGTRPDWRMLFYEIEWCFQKCLL